MANCAFCRKPILKGAQSFGIPKAISPQAKTVWDDNARDYIEFRQKDRVCVSHFAAGAKYNTGKRWMLMRNAVPTIKICDQSTGS